MTNISRFSITLAFYVAKIYLMLFSRFMSDPLLWDSPDQFNPERQEREYSQNLDASACSMLNRSIKNGGITVNFLDHQNPYFHSNSLWFIEDTRQTQPIRLKRRNKTTRPTRPTWPTWLGFLRPDQFLDHLTVIKTRAQVFRQRRHILPSGSFCPSRTRKKGVHGGTSCQGGTCYLFCHNCSGDEYFLLQMF